MRADQTRRIATLAWPIVISMLSYTAMDLADTLFVGWIGTRELAAVGLAATVLFLAQSFFMGTLQGVSIVASHAIGAGRTERARRAAVTGLAMAVPAGLIVLALSTFREPILALMGGEAAVQVLAGEYFAVRALGVPFFFVMLAICNYYQGIGETRTAMRFNLIANGLNICLDPILIFGLGPVPALGVEGAALATVIAQAIGMAIALEHFLRTRSLRGGPDRRIAMAILGLGLPMGVRFFLGFTGFTVFTALIARLGTDELAAHQIALRVISVSFLPGHGIAQAAGILAGQKIGSRQLEQVGDVLWAGLRLAWTLMGLLGLLFWIFASQIAGLFVDSPQTIRLAASLLMVGAIFQLFDATVMVLVQTLNGTGDTRFTTIATISTNWFTLLPSAYLLAVVFGFGVVGAWSAFLVELFFLNAILIWRFKSQAWRNHALQQV
jgi:multidrug resistance protein, MATE family